MPFGGRCVRPAASAQLPNEPASSTSASAEALPMRPSTIATAAGSRPDELSAGGSAVPMAPKHALCSAAVE